MTTSCWHEIVDTTFSINGTEDPVADNAGTSFDLVILGGGSGGYACALRASELDLRVALIEKDKLGGTCLHRGCIPTKALLHAGEIADNARDGADFGIRTTLEGVDMAGVNKYKDGVVNRAFRGVTGLIKSRRITIVEGEGRLVAPNAVQVNGTRYEAPNILLATGSYSRSLPGLDIDGERIITSEHALQLGDVPRSVIVLGGGVIGVEFASVWRSFGAEVTLIEALPRLLAVEDEASSKIVERVFRRRGINYKTNTPYKSVERTENGVRLTVESGETFEADLLLVAVGRGPSTTGLGLEEVGVATERGFVRTDERLRTSVEGVRAAGDIVAGLQLAHRGFQQGIFIAEDIAGLDPAVIDESGIPRVTYCDPEVASMGLTEAAATERYGADGIETFTYDLAGNPKSQILKTQGFVKLVRAKDGPVVGIHMVGARVGELVGEAQLIYNWEAFPEDVAQLIHMHPTQSEAIGEAHLALAGKPLHVHG
ncbi:dihydrolipoyl dehydrogenase [Actinopolymorpha pittospori]|uniref:Dihydrolipoyl dehydrogenase n=1 Tax=Actinopolymorpha pittospori TaxID=648752 RepID=A0A927RDF0_9ACTN|nr:dihydrolipoamide dehydrogenase [Actinopolymorpha pittospori]